MVATAKEETKDKLAQALMELMLNHPSDKISVTDIVKKAGVSRKSFYSHFQDKNALMAWIIANKYKTLTGASQTIDSVDTMETYLKFFATDRIFFANALMDMTQNAFGQYFSDLLFSTIYDDIMADFLQKNHDGKWIDFVVISLVENVRLIIATWLMESENPNPDELFEVFKEVADSIESLAESNRAKMCLDTDPAVFSDDWIRGIELCAVDPYQAGESFYKRRTLMRKYSNLLNFLPASQQD